MRAHEVAEQRAAAGAEEPGEAAGDLFLLFGLDAAPRVDQLVAGEVERRVRVDLVDLVRLYGVDRRSCVRLLLSWRSLPSASSLSTAR